MMTKRFFENSPSNANGRTKWGVSNSPYTTVLFVALVYVALVALSLDHCFFWDNIQQTSKEAHWFYQTNFSSLFLPSFSSNSEIVGTGYHPPLMGIMTALLWKVFGVHLWVSHLFVLCWALLLVYSAHRLVNRLFPRPYSSWLVLVLLLESTVLAQISTATPDVVLLATFVTALMAIVEQRRVLMVFALLFLGLVNGRGMFAVAILFVFDLAYVYWSIDSNLSAKWVSRRLVPFLPVGLVLATYFTCYFAKNGWFFGAENTTWGEGWKSPEGVGEYLKNIAAYGLRLLENGRFIVWMFGFWLLYKFYKNREFQMVGGVEKSLLVVVALFFVLYLYFALTTKLVIVPRYYMPMFFVLTLLVARLAVLIVSPKHLKIGFAGVLLLLLTGHFWVYPEKMSKAWDASLAHWNYYELRNDCFEYIHDQHIDVDEVGAGFCFFGNQRYVDLRHENWTIGNDTTRRYFIYSNISNVDDDSYDQLHDASKWRVVRSFNKGYVKIELLEKLNSSR